MWLVLLLAGFAGIGAGGYEAVLHRRLRREGIRAEGLVVRHCMRSRPTGVEGRSGTTFSAVVEFVDVQGSPHEFEVKLSGVKGLPVGGRAPVRYLPGAPKTARLDLVGKRFGSVVLPLACGVVFMAAAMWMLATGR